MTPSRTVVFAGVNPADEPPPTLPRPPAFGLLLLGLALGVVALALVSVSVGSVPLSLAEVWRIVVAHLGLAGATADTVADQIVWTVRLPRTLLAILVGAGLGVAGTVIQAVVRNPLGDPQLIGVTPGAGFGAVLVIVLGSDAIGGAPLAAAAFAGALLAFAVVFLLGRSGGEWPPARLVLAGVAVGYVFSSATYFLQILATPSQVQRVLYWSLGSVSGAQWRDLPLLTAVVVLGAGWLVIAGGRLNALVSGADLARSLGVDVGRFQLQLMLLAALVTGCVVTVSGGIGFVGLMVPHIARQLVGTDHRRVLPCALLIGAAVLLVADLIARLVLAPAELPVGVVTAAIGAPFFVWLLASGRRGVRTAR
ncbi:FecCD family ABC transporter permease [Micropruina sp.]|uniref:FecCD family ABC transporter permease n=1 Tax=Micropruina sp. TaxID=2737536 RepID=UPI0039E50E98